MNPEWEAQWKRDEADLRELRGRIHQHVPRLRALNVMAMALLLGLTAATLFPHKIWRESPQATSERNIWLPHDRVSCGNIGCACFPSNGKCTICVCGVAPPRR